MPDLKTPTHTLPPFVAHCLELLGPGTAAAGPLRWRRMFGGYGFYAGDVFMALIAFDRLYLKTDSSTEPLFAQAGCEKFVYVGANKTASMSYWTAPEDAMDSAQAMTPWARRAVQSALQALNAKAPKSAPKSATKPATKPRKAAAGTAPSKPAKQGLR
jgi:DNA transformation protein and related proteins